MSFRFDDKDGAVSMVTNSVRDTAKQESTQPADSVASDNDQVRAFLFGNVDDFRGWVSYNPAFVHAQPSLQERLRCPGDHVVLNLLDKFVSHFEGGTVHAHKCR